MSDRLMRCTMDQTTYTHLREVTRRYASGVIQNRVEWPNYSVGGIEMPISDWRKVRDALRHQGRTRKPSRYLSAEALDADRRTLEILTAAIKKNESEEPR